MFRNRKEAGRLLASEIPALYTGTDSIIMAIDRGGIPVGCSMSIELRLPVDIIFARRIPMIGMPHIGVGAITASGEKVYNQRLLNQYGLKEFHFKAYEEEVLRDLKKEINEIRSSSSIPDLTVKTVILTDDGISSGYTMLVAIRCVKKRGAKKVVVAVPVSSFVGYKLVSEECDDFICMRICSEPGFSVQSFYDTSRIDLEEARECIKIAKKEGVGVF